MWQNQARWAKSTRHSRPWGHLGSGLVYAMPYGIMGLLAAGWLGYWPVGVLLFVLALLNRMFEAWAVGWWVVRDPKVHHAPWIYPLRDLLGFFVWCASYLGARTVWRNRPYELVDGRIAPRQT
jgi:ceramide glucosyltransferase